MDFLDLSVEEEPEVFVEEPLSVGLLSSLIPVAGSEFEDAFSGPLGQEAQEVSEVGLGVDSMHAGTGEEGGEGGVDLGAVIAAEEKPVLSPERLPTELSLRNVVCRRQPAIVEKTPERAFLVERVANRRGERSSIKYSGFMGPTKSEVPVDQGFPLGFPHPLPLLARLFGKSSLEKKHQAEVVEKLARDVRLGVQRLEEVVSCVAPARDLGGTAFVHEKMVVHAVGIGHDIPFVSLQELVDGVGGVVVTEGEDHMLLRSHQHPEMTASAFLRSLYQDSRRIRAHVRSVSRIGPHRVHQRKKQFAKVVEPAVERRPSEPHALPLVHVFETVVRKMVFEAADDHIRQKPRARHRTSQRELWRTGLGDPAFRVRRRVLPALSPPRLDGLNRRFGFRAKLRTHHLRWTPNFRPGAKLENGACSRHTGAGNGEEKTTEVDGGVQVEGCAGGRDGAGIGGGTLPTAPSSREPDLPMEEAAAREAARAVRVGRGAVPRRYRSGSGASEEDRGADDGARFFIERARSLPVKSRRELVDREASLSVRQQCELLRVNRSSLYYEPVGPDEEEQALMRRIDLLHLDYPFYGSRKVTEVLRHEGHQVNRKRIQRLMRVMDLHAVAPQPKTSEPAPEHPKYPYLLRGLRIDRVNQVWASDITYIPLAHGWAYLVAVMDWYSRRVLSWRLSNTLDSRFCVEALTEALATYGTPEIFNTDQGSQFTAEAFTGPLRERGVKISMDGRGRYLDNIFVERLWRSLKYEEVYLHEYADVAVARRAIERYWLFYNEERPHQALGYQTPGAFYGDFLGRAA